LIFLSLFGFDFEELPADVVVHVAELAVR